MHKVVTRQMATALYSDSRGTAQVTMSASMAIYLSDLRRISPTSQQKWGKITRRSPLALLKTLT
jgi:hypothetical protein